MLIKSEILKAVKSRHVDLVFRKWKAPRVKKGTLLKTHLGQMEVIEIKRYTIGKITTEDAKRSGYKDRNQLIENLNKVKEGEVYRICIRFHSPDPRIKLRQQIKLSAEAADKLQRKLKRLDDLSSVGQWTSRTMKAIRDNPGLRAADLANKLNYEKDWLKPNIRKLKNLGLTISLEVGYELSPLGKAWLQKK